jgi:hypothetical protein
MLTGWADQQASLGDTCTHCCEALGALEELHDLHEVLLGLLNTSNVVKHHTSVGLHLETSLALAYRAAEGERHACSASFPSKNNGGRTKGGKAHFK